MSDKSVKKKAKPAQPGPISDPQERVTKGVQIVGGAEQRSDLVPKEGVKVVKRRD